MQGLTDRILESKSLTLLVIVAALAAVSALAFLAVRLLQRRVKAPNGRARPPRLGVVDVFDLDRRRQLVLIRRDNVEHLVLIGGPNDVLIEAEIVRAETRERPREKEPTLAHGVAAPTLGPAEPEPPRPLAEAMRKPAPAVEAAKPAEPVEPAAHGQPPQAPAPQPRAPAAPPPPAALRRAPGPSSLPPLPPRPPREPILKTAPPRAPLATPFLRPTAAPRQLAETLGRRAPDPRPAAAAPPAPEPSARETTHAPREDAPEAAVPAPKPVGPKPVDPTPAAETKPAAPAPQDERAQDPAPASPALAAPVFDLAAALEQALLGDPQPLAPKHEPAAPETVEAEAPPADDAKGPPAKIEADPFGDSLEEEMARLLGRAPDAP